MNIDLSSALFYFLAAVMLFSALGIIYCRNLVHSALFMALCFISVAGLYAMINADFLAAVQIMIYAGTVVILIVLGIMITRRTTMERTSMPEKKYILRSSVLAGILFFLLSYIFITAGTLPTLNTAALPDDTVSALAELLLDRYMLAFEIAAVLLLAAMIGAVVLAKGADEK